MPYSIEFESLALGEIRRVAVRVALLRIRECGHLDESVEGFWNPFFTALVGRDPQQTIKPGRYPEDDLIWDKVIPVGYRVLQRLRSLLSKK